VCPSGKSREKGAGAIREVVKRLVQGRKRVLLSMATGTGKTFLRFQVVWKLVKSGWLQRVHSERPGRVLFLADRVVLRDQLLLARDLL